MRARANKVPDALMLFQKYSSAAAPAPNYYASLLGFRKFDWPHLLQAVEEGFPYDAFERLRENTGLSADDVAAWLQLAPRTLTRRKQQGSFAPDESDRILRAARVLGRALELFDGDREAAVEWLQTPQRALAGIAPVDVARTEVGAREVENLIGRLEHGVFS
jgi:putative toxin-antitoxin system antitoxin component (TIGR02293 family)